VGDAELSFGFTRQGFVCQIGRFFSIAGGILAALAISNTFGSDESRLIAATGTFAVAVGAYAAHYCDATAIKLAQSAKVQTMLKGP
jgi:hypothetical protein